MPKCYSIVSMRDCYSIVSAKDGVTVLLVQETYDHMEHIYFKRRYSIKVTFVSSTTGANVQTYVGLFIKQTLCSGDLVMKVQL